MDEKMKAGLLVGLAILSVFVGVYYVLGSQDAISQNQEEAAALSQTKASMDQQEAAEKEMEEEAELYEPTQEYKDLAPYRTVHIPIRITDGLNEKEFDMEVEFVNWIANNDIEWKNLQTNFKESVMNGLNAMNKEDGYWFIPATGNMQIMIDDISYANRQNFQTFIENVGYLTILSIYNDAGYKNEAQVKKDPLRLRVAITVSTKSGATIANGSIDLDTISYYAHVAW